MECRKYSRLILTVVFILLYLFVGCGSKEEKKLSVATEQEKSGVEQAAPQSGVPVTPSPAPQAEVSTVIIDVDGSKMTQGQIDAEIKKKMAEIKGKIPAERMTQVKADVRKQIINDFTVRTLLANEVNRMKISVSDQELSESVERLKISLPQGMTIEDFMKNNKINKEKMYDEMRFGIKVNKLVLSQSDVKSKPTDKEITKFYQKNKAKFTVPESVHVRHILVAKAAGDDEKIKAEKRVKAENLRKQVLAGADFAEIAKTDSDCPSKNSGGDLGVFSRGEMVKPFENAAFSQEKNAIGPVVETDFGFHIIQVLDHISSKTMALDDTIKARIASFLLQQKQQETFEALVNKLKTKAKIFIYQN
jgi:peptidyl-prolyl cis-trans isomerase C